MPASSSASAVRIFPLCRCVAAAVACQVFFCLLSLSAQEIVKPLLFSGAATVVAPPTADTEYAFGPEDFGAFYRMADCELEAIIGNTTSGSSPSYKTLSVTESYQDTLHTLAGLTTKGNAWPDGCGNPGANNPAYFAADAGQTSSKKYYVVATIDKVNPNVIDIYNLKPSLMKPSITKVQTLNIGTNVFPIAAVDLNGDGLPDVVVGAEGTNYPSPLNGGYAVLINEGNGMFDAPTFVTLPGEGVIALAMADVNHDGNQDLIALEASLNFEHFEVGIFLGNGKGAFTLKDTYKLSGSTYNILVADINGDGNPDVILANGAVLLGDGNGTFKTGKTLPLPADVTSFVAADFNHDNKIDLAVVTPNDEVAVFLGNGNGTLQAPTWYSGVYQGEVITTADLDGDGNLDLILAAQSGGGFSPAPSVMGGTGGLGVLMGAGDGTFKGASAYSTGNTGTQLAYAIADINGDGIPDILTASSLLVGNGKGQFTVTTGNQFPGLSPSSVGSVIRVANLTSSKQADAVVTTVDSDLNPSAAYVFLGKSTGKFGTGKKLSIANVMDVAIADFNGDNIPDLAVLSYTVGSGISLHVLLGTGSGSFAAPLTITLPASVSQSTGGRIFAAEFNTDKNMDLLVLDVGNYQNSVDGGAYVLLGNGKGGFTLSATLTEVKNPFDAAIADFNKDGNLDVVISSTDFNESFTTAPLIFLGSGKGTFGAGKSLPTVSNMPLHMVAADFNGDGDPDLVIGNCCGLAVTSILFGKGNGSFDPEQVMQVAESPSQIAVADLNGDGMPDIVISSGNAAGMLVTLINEYTASK